MGVAMSKIVVKLMMGLFVIIGLGLLGCGGNISFSENATFSLKSDSTSIPAKLTATIVQNDSKYRVEGGTVTFTADKPELVTISSPSQITDGSGAATTVVTVKTGVTIPTSGVTVVITASINSLSQSVPLLIEPPK